MSDLPFITIPPDQPDYETLTELTMEQKAELPGRFHTPICSNSIPGAFICRVCWDEGEMTSWPCKAALNVDIPDLKIPCPQCGSTLDIDWLEMSSFNRTEKTFLPDEIKCPDNPRHDVSAARQELDWPTSLTEEDRAWLRQHGRLTP